MDLGFGKSELGPEIGTSGWPVTGGAISRRCLVPGDVLPGGADAGLPSHEDHFMPGYFIVQCDASGDFTMIVSAEPISPVSYEGMEQEAVERQSGLLSTAGCQDEFARQLVLAADDFLVRRESTGKRTIIAGYPWFNDWGLEP